MPTLRGTRGSWVFGAGRGYLQDIVENYVGLDISVSAQRYFHSLLCCVGDGHAFPRQ